MKTCPACHRTVPEQATVCPHPGCGRPLSAASAAGLKKRPPPPPGKVHLAPGGTQPAASQPTPGTDERSHRGPLTTVALLLLLLVLAGGVYYAAVASKPGAQKPVEPALAQAPSPQAGTEQQAAHPVANETDQATSEKGVADEKKPSQQPAAEKSGAEKRHAAKPAESGELAEGKATPKKPETPEQPPTEVAAVMPPSQPLGLYAERTRVDREEFIAGVGGTPVSEQAVAAGLEWLARHQAEDGHWGPDCLGASGSRCEKDHPCGGHRGGPFEAAQTGLAILAFQAGGNYDFNGKSYSDHVRRGLDWLVAHQGPNGEIVGSNNHVDGGPAGFIHYDQHYMYEHSIATFALAEACAVARAAQRHPDEKYLAAATKAVRFIEDQQHNDGGWRYTPEKTSPSDASISGWAMLALKTAKEADLKVEEDTVSRMTAFFEQLADPLTGRTHYQGTAYLTHATTGVGMMVDEFIKHEPQSELVRLGASYLADEAEAGWGKEKQQRMSDFYAWYNCTLAMFLAGGDTWDRWNNVIRDHLVSLQIHGEGCERGSWEPNDRWGDAGGRIYSTALSVLSLEVYYRFTREKAAAEKKQ